MKVLACIIFICIASGVESRGLPIKRSDALHKLVRGVLDKVLINLDSKDATKGSDGTSDYKALGHKFSSIMKQMKKDVEMGFEKVRQALNEVLDETVDISSVNMVVGRLLEKLPYQNGDLDNIDFKREVEKRRALIITVLVKQTTNEMLTQATLASKIDEGFYMGVLEDVIEQFEQTIKDLVKDADNDIWTILLTQFFPIASEVIDEESGGSGEESGSGEDIEMSGSGDASESGEMSGSGNANESGDASDSEDLNGVIYGLKSRDARGSVESKSNDANGSGKDESKTNDSNDSDSDDNSADWISKLNDENGSGSDDPYGSGKGDEYGSGSDDDSKNEASLNDLLFGYGKDANAYPTKVVSMDKRISGKVEPSGDNASPPALRFLDLLEKLNEVEASLDSLEKKIQVD